MEHLMESILGPKDWGWRLAGASLVPAMTDQEPALDELLKIIRCNPQAMSKNLYSGKEFLVVLMDLRPQLLVEAVGELNIKIV